MEEANEFATNLEVTMRRALLSVAIALTMSGTAYAGGDDFNNLGLRIQSISEWAGFSAALVELGITSNSTSSKYDPSKDETLIGFYKSHNATMGQVRKLL